MNYCDAIRESMEMLAENKKRIFLGYNVARGSMAYGTLKNVSKDQLLETPCAENLMGGLAMGMSLRGFKPLLYFERHDFMFNGMDSLANYLDKFEEISDGQFKTPVIVRAVIGGTKPFWPGPQHVQDLSDVFQKLFKFPVHRLNTPKEIIERYQEASNFDGPTMLIEKRDWYGRT
jgi:pyruvate/2-oxoglutarate/acetoin dehydrogenase E1 component